MFELDPHTHSLSSGHAGWSTITDLAKQASSVGLKALGLTDHAPATFGSSRASYFRNLAYAPKKRCGIEILYGVELNILDKDGSVDLEDEILENLDYAIISMHMPNIKPGTVEENTFAYVNAMKHPRVKIVGHPEDVKYPIDYNLDAIRTLVRRAMKMGFYEGVNLSLAYCDDCGYQELEMDECPKCGSRNLTKIDRMNGYLSYSRIHGDTRLNAAKMAEIKERKSM